MNNIQQVLEKLPGVMSVTDVGIQDGIIERLSIESNTAGRLTVRRLNDADAAALFDFYFNGLSETSRNFFPPYPLFAPPPVSVAELSQRIVNWKKEDDWTLLNLFQDERIIGTCLLKRYHTERPTSGLAVSEDFRKKGLGRLLQAIVNQQARLLKLSNIHVTMAQENDDSLQVHLKSGFKRTGKLVPHFGYKDGRKVVDRQDIEMVIEFH